LLLSRTEKQTTDEQLVAGNEQWLAWNEQWLAWNE
jgi:hypothetical protein